MNRMEKTPEKFICEKCHFKCKKLCEWNRHTSTRKHLFAPISNSKNADEPFYCKKCNKPYKAKSSLWYHEKKCNYIETENTISKETNSTVIDNTSILLELTKQNQEFKTMLLEQSNKINELTVQNSQIQNNITNNTTNNSFNLNVFLNETCKDAMNIVDFVNSMKLTIEDFENTGRLGFVDGITRIFIKELKGIDVEKRPVHCTDAKRETVYIKDNNTWEKENNEKKKFKWIINRIAQLNLNQLQYWQQKYPESVINNTKANEKFTELTLVALGGRGQEQEEKFREKIIRNVIKEVILDKKM